MKIKEGDKIPNSEFYYLDEGSVLKKISTPTLFDDNKTIVIGVPGAFTKVCSVKHLPSYVNNFKNAQKKGITKIICVSVNDPNVMKAWGESQNVGNNILMAGDPFLKFTKSIGAEVDKSAKGLGIRSNRYTMLVEDDVLKKVEEEKETAICELSAAENFLKTI